MTPPRLCVLVPVYNHDRTVKRVVEGARLLLPVIVANDGSTDGTAGVLAEVSGLTLITLPYNQGKAAALRAGFQRAREAGLTHVITMDADGQHPVEALPEFVEACQRSPDAFVIGVRDLRSAGAPPARRFANWLSTLTFRMETGIRLNDTQCGYRCYPLALLDQLRIHSRHYAYESEVMIRAAWAGMPFVPLPIETDYQAPTSRLSHFHPFVDFLRIFRMHLRLCPETVCVSPLLRRHVSFKSFRDAPTRHRLRNVSGQVFIRG